MVEPLMNEPDHDVPKTKPGLDLPRDIYGRIACVLAGLLFGVCGTSALVGLIGSGAGIGKFVYYELSAFAAVFGVALVLWGLAVPRWIEGLVDRVVRHVTLVFGLLFLPFVIEFLVFAFQGKV